MTNDELIIHNLLQRFMDGKTTVAEEQQIARWLREHPEARGDDLDIYREMFAWFDEGMPQDQTGSQAASDDADKPTVKPGRNRRWWRVAASVAAVAVVTASLVLTHGLQDETAQQAQMAQKIVQPKDSTQNVEILGDTLSPKTMEPRQAKPRRRSYYRHKFSPAPPVVLMASADSAALEHERKAERQLDLYTSDELLNKALAKLEDEQKKAWNNVDSITARADRYIMAILSDDALDAPQEEQTQQADDEEQFNDIH